MPRLTQTDLLSRVDIHRLVHVLPAHRAQSGGPDFCPCLRRRSVEQQLRGRPGALRIRPSTECHTASVQHPFATRRGRADHRFYRQILSDGNICRLLFIPASRLNYERRQRLPGVLGESEIYS